MWRTVAVCSDSGPTMKPGVSTSESSGSPNASHSCMKRAALSEPSASSAPDRCLGSFAITPTGAALDPRERGERRCGRTPGAAPARSRCRRACAAGRARRGRASGRRGSRRAAAPGRRRTSRRARAPEVGEEALARPRPPPPRRPRRTSITPLRLLHARPARPPRARSEPSPPPSIIAGPPIPMLASGVAITTSQQPSSAALPAKQRPETIPTRGTRPRQPRERVEARDDEVEQLGRVGVARPPAAALGEQHDRQPVALGELQQAVGLAVVADPLRAGEDRVVVGEDRGALGRRRVADRRSRSRRPASSRSAPRSERRARCAASVSAPYSEKEPGSHRSATFSRAVRSPVAWRRSTAAGRAASSLAQPAALQHLGEVGADRVARRRRRSAALVLAPAVDRPRRLDAEQRLPLRRPAPRPRPPAPAPRPPPARPPRGASSSPRRRAPPPPPARPHPRPRAPRRPRPSAATRSARGESSRRTASPRAASVRAGPARAAAAPTAAALRLQSVERVADRRLADVRQRVDDLRRGAKLRGACVRIVVARLLLLASPPTEPPVTCATSAAASKVARTRPASERVAA